MKPLALGLLAGCLLLSACGNSSQAQPEPLFTHFQVAPTFHTSHPTQGVGIAVSMVEVGPGDYLLCDYGNIYRLTRVGVSYVAGQLAGPVGVPWSPTGLAYHDGLVFVANGGRHDVLLLRLSTNRLDLVGRFTNPAMVTPQNLAVGSDGTIVVADVDSGTGPGAGALLKFQADGTLQWRLPIKKAHGVTESGGAIFVTSMIDRVIYRVDQTGRVEKAAGAIGATKPHYLWPVALAAASGGRVLVTDALNGRITTLNRDLVPQSIVGGNGPGVDALNYPYATLPVADGYLIVDTYKRRIVHTNSSWVMLDQVALGPMVPTGRVRPLVYVTEAHPYTYEMLPGVDIAGEVGLRRSMSFVGGYDALEHFESRTSTQFDLTDLSLGLFTNATWAQKVDSFIVVGSPENEQILVIEPATGMFTYLEVGFDTWWRSGALLMPDNLRRDLSDVVRPAAAMFVRSEQLLLQGVGRQAAFDQALSNGVPRNWSADLASPQAKQFVASGMTKQAAADYFAWALQQRSVNAVELLDVKYLSGA
jgi:hypothetical protein